MARVKRGSTTRRRRNRILKQAKGYYGGQSRMFRTAKQSVARALNFAYIGRKQKKRQYRQLWIARINAATREHGLSYSKFMHGLKQSNIEINRKNLSEMAIHDPESFSKLVELAKNA